MTYKLKLETHKAKAAAAEYILNLPKKPVTEVTVKVYSRQRSLEANARHWSLLSQIQYWMAKRGEDHSAETWHLYFLSEFDEPETNVVKGKMVQRYSSKEMTSFQFNEYCNEIEAWAGDNEITLLGLEEWRAFRKQS